MTSMFTALKTWVSITLYFVFAFAIMFVIGPCSWMLNYLICLFATGTVELVNIIVTSYKAPQKDKRFFEILACVWFGILGLFSSIVGAVTITLSATFTTLIIGVILIVVFDVIAEQELDYVLNPIKNGNNNENY